MIFNDELLFIHVPKTAGMSMGKALLRSLKGHVYMEVSRYHYLRKGHEWDKGNSAELALAGNFPEFVAGSKWWFSFQDYYSINGVTPDNLHIVRFENFAFTMQRTFGSCSKAEFSVKRLNKSHNTNYRKYYTDELESLVYKKYQWIFDRGYYAREEF